MIDPAARERGHRRVHSNPKGTAMSYYGQRVTLREVKSSPSLPQNVDIKIKKLENNTFEIVLGTGERRIRLHQTDIIIFDADGFSVHTGGYKTITTKDRLNKYLPDGWRVYSDKGTWYLRRGEDKAVFEDGMRSDHFERYLKTSSWRENGQAKLKARIKKFVDDKLGAGKAWPQPSQGDCWFCALTTTPPKAEAKPDAIRNSPTRTQAPTLGETRGPEAEREHILDHIKDGYMHGSLIVNALRWAGCTDFYIGMCFQGGSESFKRVARQRIRRYLQFKLGLPY
jgi:hypothetical protein